MKGDKRMNDDKRLADLLGCAIQIMGRLAIPPDKVSEIVGAKKKLIEAYNLCDGTRSQKEVVKTLRLDQGSFSATSKRWVRNGVAFWIGEGKETRLLHLYPLSTTSVRQERGNQKQLPKRK
jgi:hypothetical protein